MAGTLYGAKGGNANSDLYTIDPVTAAQTSVGPIGHAVTGLAFDPTDGTLFAITSALSPTNPSWLITINPATGATLSLIADLLPGTIATPADICFDPTGQLYLAEKGGGFYKVDKATGAVTLVGGRNNGSGDGWPSTQLGGAGFGNGCEYRQSDGLLIVFPAGGTGSTPGWGTVWTDVPTAAPTAYGVYHSSTTLTGGPFTDGPAIAACAYDGAGLLWAIENDFPTCHLVKINTSTGAITDVGALADKFDGLAWLSPPAGPDLGDPPGAGIVIRIYDLGTNLLADITAIALEKTLKRRLNLTRSFIVQAPAGDPLLSAIAADGFPNLRKGNRKLLVWEDGDIIYHGRIFNVERLGDGTKNRVTITALDPLMELGYDADDRAGRPVRDATGNLINPSFEGTGTGGPDVTSGPDLIKQVLTNSQQVGDESDPTPGEGPLPIDLASGTFDLDVPPALDLSMAEAMAWPILCGDFIAQIVSSGVVDIDLRPIDPFTESFDPYIMVALSAVSSFGTDRSATVHFDYWTGSKNASACRHVEDFATINNKLYDYLGPRDYTDHWRALITPGSPGTTVDPTTSRARYGGSGADKGQFMSIRETDILGALPGLPPLNVALWNAEQGYRIEPRDMLFITPNPGDKALFEALTDYDVGDLVAVNTGTEFGVALAEAQRVYGFDVTWDRQGVKRVSELITSADAE